MGSPFHSADRARFRVAAFGPLLAQRHGRSICVFQTERRDASYVLLFTDTDNVASTKVLGQGRKYRFEIFAGVGASRVGGDEEITGP